MSMRSSLASILGRKEKISQQHYSIFLLLWLPVLALLIYISMFISIVLFSMKIAGLWSMFVIAGILSLFISYPYMKGRIRDFSSEPSMIEDNGWLKFYRFILYIHLVIGVVLCCSGSPPAIFVFSFWIFSLIPMIAIAFKKQSPPVSSSSPQN